MDERSTVWTEGLTNGAGIIDGFSGATPLAHAAAGEISRLPSLLEMFIGTIPGSIGETSTLMILLGAVILIATGIGSWKIMVSVFAGGAFMGILLNLAAANEYMTLPFYYHFVMGVSPSEQYLWPLIRSRHLKQRGENGFMIFDRIVLDSLQGGQSGLPRRCNAGDTLYEPIRSANRPFRGAGQHQEKIEEGSNSKSRIELENNRKQRNMRIV